MKKLLLLVFITSQVTAGRISRDMGMFIREIHEHSPLDQRARRPRSCPSPDTMKYLQEILNFDKPHFNTPVPLERKDEHSIDFDTVSTLEQTQTLDEKEDKVIPHSRCTPAKAVIVGSVCTGIVAIVTALVAAVVTITIHLTTK